jgi:acylphosphatase
VDDLARLRAIVHGHVQGVFFREDTRRRGETLGLKGLARNLPDGTSVEVVAEGKKEDLRALADFLRTGPPAARVDRVETEWSDYSGEYTEFMTG